MRKKIRLRVSLIFTLTVLILFIFTTPPLRSERRLLAVRPPPTILGFWRGSYFSELELFLNDHFPSRTWLIYLKGKIDLVLFHKPRKDLLLGTRDVCFYRAIATNYLPGNAAQFPYERWKLLLSRLNERAKADDKILVFQTFRNKEYIFREQLPIGWRILANKTDLPLEKVRVWAQINGIQTADYTEILENGKNIDLQWPFTKLEENHYSPNVFFIVMKNMLNFISRYSDVDVQEPKDFPKLVTKSIYEENYRSVHYVNTNYPGPPEWTSVSSTFAEPGKLKGKYFYAQNKNSGKLPATVVYSDSFIETLCSQFGYVFLPYFKNFSLHWTEGGTEGWHDAKVVVISVSDQNAPNAPSWLEELANNLDRVDQDIRN